MTTLQELVETAVDFQVLTGEAQDERPQIEVLDMDIPPIAAEAWSALHALNDRSETPVLFQRGTNLCRVEYSGSGAILALVEKKRMRGILARSCIFQQTYHGKRGDFIKVVAPPEPVIDDMLVNVDHTLPIINRVVRAPCLALDGSVLTTKGYHEEAHAYYDPWAGVDIPTVSERPTQGEMERARALILDDLLCDFPFVEQADRAHAVALMLLPFVRELIDGPTPLHFVEAPTMGSGKGLLTDVQLIVATGTVPIPMSAPTEESEWNKKITAALMGGPSAIFIDNINHTLDSGALAAALTTVEWTDRVLGVSEMVRTPVRCVWVATGNNPMLSTEIARRCIRIRIDPKIDKPWERAGFKHPSLRQWVRDNQGELIWAALTLARYGRAHGTPGRALGSYEDWSQVIGGILNGIGIPGFLDNLDALYDRADVQMASWRALTDIWWDTHADSEVQASDLFALAEKNDIELGLRGKTERALKTAFGMALSKMEDRILTISDPNPAAGRIHLRIETTGKTQGLKLWRLHRVDMTAPPAKSVPSVPNVPCVPSTPARTYTQGIENTPSHPPEPQGTQGTLGTPDFWSNVPPESLAKLQSLLRSVNPKLQAVAQSLCTRFQLDYDAARAYVQQEQPQ